MGIMPVFNKKLITPESSLLTNAAMIPRADNLMNSYIFAWFELLKNGYIKTNS